MLKKILEENDLNHESCKYGTDKDVIHSYIEIYEKEFSRFKNKKINLLEIGSGCGSSLNLWSKYFDNANIYGVDIGDFLLEKNKNLKNVNINFFNAYDRNHLLDLKFDILIDDGPHTLNTQITFLNLYLPTLKENGILIIEDMQSLDDMKLLDNYVDKKYTIEHLDLRSIKNRYDDMLYIIKY